MKSLDDLEVRKLVLQRLMTLQPGTKPQWGRMSAHQMICHLSDSFRTALGQKHASPSTGLFQRTVMKWVALHLPAPWPKNLPTRPEVDQCIGGTAPVEFERDRAELVRLMKTFCDSGRTLRYPHPLFGNMTDNEWVRWGYLHVDHHLRQFGI